MITNHQRYRRTDRQRDGRYATPRVHCAVKTAEPVIEILSLSDRPIILTFCHQGLLPKSDCFTPNRGAEYKRIAIVAKKRGYISSLVLRRQQRPLSQSRLELMT